MQSDDIQQLFDTAVKNDDVNAVNNLITNETIDITANNNAAVKWAARQGHLGLVKRLLIRGVDPSVGDDYPFREAAATGRTEVVRFLLQDSRVNPRSHHDWAFTQACLKGHASVVELLLQDGRCDPSTQNNSGLAWAAQNGHEDVIDLLVKEHRIRYWSCDHRILEKAYNRGYISLTNKLINSGKMCLNHVSYKDRLKYGMIITQKKR